MAIEAGNSVQERLDAFSKGATSSDKVDSLGPSIEELSKCMQQDPASQDTVSNFMDALAAIDLSALTKSTSSLEFVNNKVASAAGAA